MTHLGHHYGPHDPQIPTHDGRGEMFQTFEKLSAVFDDGLVELEYALGRVGWPEDHTRPRFVSAMQSAGADL